MMDTFEIDKLDSFYSFPFNIKSEEPMELDNDPNLNDLAEILSNSSAQFKDADIISLNDIPLTEVAESNILQLIPDNVPNDSLLLLKIPENLQNDDLLKDIMDIDLDLNILDSLHESMADHEGLLLADQQDETPMEVEDENIEFEIARRKPLQVIQQIIKYPVVKSIFKPSKEVGIKKANKRKQQFVYPREDFVEFYSDDDEKLASPINLDSTLPKKFKTEELLDVLAEPAEKVIKSKPKPKTEVKKVNSKSQTCPRCDKTFKRLALHKCKIFVPAEQTSQLQKLKPSDIPLPMKCEICKQFFRDQKAFEEHQMEKHSHLVCKICKHAMKNVQGLKIHALKCGIKIEAVEKKIVKENSQNKK